jgi:hypothetical protein
LYHQGLLFGLQTGDFSQCLIQLKGNDYSNRLEIKEQSDLECNPIYIDYQKSLKENKNPFSLACIKEKIKVSTISNDASCSGTSILSGILGIYTGLIKTNVFVDINNDLKKKRCIYRHFLYHLKDNYPENCEVIYSSKEITTKLKMFKLSNDEFVQKIDYLLEFVKDKLLTREHVKQFVMRKNYAESNKGRLDYIYKEILFPESSALNEYFTNFKDKEKFLKSFCYYVARWIDDSYAVVFPEIADFCNMLIEHFENQSKITLSSPTQSDFAYKQLIYETKKINRFSLKSKRSRELNVRERTNIIDSAKVKRSLVANFMHYLDSRLKFGVFYKCYESGIVVWGNHDCFYVCVTQKDKLLKHYFDVFEALLLSEDVVGHCFRC